MHCLYRSMRLILLALTFVNASLASEKPNFVIVLADDVSWSSFGCTDGGLYTRTPHIDKLASEGLQFTNFMYFLVLEI